MSETAPAGAIKSTQEIEAIARAGRVVAESLVRAASECRAGVSTASIDQVIGSIIRSHGAQSLFFGCEREGAPHFPGHACISLNEQVVHGVPGQRRLANGDVVTIDVGVRLDGWCADAATTVIVGGPDAAEPGHAEMLRRLLAEAIAMIRPGVRWTAIARALEVGAGAAGLGIVTEYIGHGIGRELHEWPSVPAYATGFAGADFELAEGMVLAIEPIVTARGPGRARGRGLPDHASRVCLCPDGWTVATVDSSWAAHEERTIAVLASGARNLTEFELAGA